MPQVQLHRSTYAINGSAGIRTLTRTILSFVLTLVLLFTLPLYQSGQTNVPIRGSLKWTVFARHQSSAWADSGDAAPWWLVRQQAEPFEVLRGTGEPGQSIQVQEPLVTRHPAFYHVITINLEGDTSAISNIVGIQ